MKLRSKAAKFMVLIVGSCFIASCAHQPRPQSARPAPRKIVRPPKMRAPSPGRTVETRMVRCPSEAEIKKLRAARPKPLRNQKMPATAAERVARTAAQLGLYEAGGQWADQVERAFAACDAD